jgi:hypothetical protein
MKALLLKMNVGLALGFGLIATATAQSSTPALVKPDDIASATAIVKASYEAISGPPGQTLNLDRFRSLFLPSAQLVSVSLKNGMAEARTMTVDQFITIVTGAIGKAGHFERELSERVDAYGNIANVWSAYESRTMPDDPHVVRGINSIQLFYDGKRWWISGAQWQHESPDAPLPAKYLSAER